MVQAAALARRLAHSRRPSTAGQFGLFGLGLLFLRLGASMAVGSMSLGVPRGRSTVVHVTPRPFARLLISRGDGPLRRDRPVLVTAVFVHEAQLPARDPQMRKMQCPTLGRA